MELHWLSAVLATYALSRLLWRVPLPAAGPVRLVLVDGLSAAILIALGVALRESVAVAGVLWLGLTQAAWLVLDGARGRGLTAPLSATRAASS